MPYTATLQLRAKVQPSIKFKAKVQPNIKIKAQGLGEMISIRVSLSSTTFLNRGAVAFSPYSLFTFGTEGIWLDPSDVANLAWRRNLLTYSEQFDAAIWNKATNVTVTANAAAAPTGEQVADKLIATSASGLHRATHAVTVATATAHTATIYAKVGEYTVVALREGAVTGAWAQFDLSAGTVRGSGNGGTGSITSVGSGWYRCSMVMTTAGTSYNTDVYVMNSSLNPAIDPGSQSWTGDNTSGILIWGAQLELGSVATDYQRISDVNTEVIERFPSATMYQDAAGTTPVTTPGQPVGLRLDKSKGLALGAELVANGTFDTGTTGWTVGASWSVTGGKAVVAVASTASAMTPSTFSLVAGKSYRVVVNVERTAGTLYIRQGSNLFESVNNTRTVNKVFVAPANGSIEFLALSDFTGSIDNISVRELPGNHAVQSVLASRPTYGIEPAGGRRNLLTFSEDLSNAVWAKSSSNVDANSTNAPTGAATADTARLAVGASLTIAASGLFTSSTVYVSQPTAAALTAGTHTYSVYVKGGVGLSHVQLRVGPSASLNPAVGYVTVRLSDGELTTGSGGEVVSNAGGGWWRVSIPFTATAAVHHVGIWFWNTSSIASAVGTEGIYLWGAQLELGSTATPYQRVTTAFDVTEAGVQTCHYVEYDGSDDGMITNSIDFTATDKMSVFAGVRKLSDAAVGVVVELSAIIDSNAGSFVLAGPASVAAPNHFFGSRGSLFGGGATSPSSYSAPITNLLTGIGDISGDLSAIRVNGTQVAQNILNQGTGNYGNYRLNIGRRGNDQTTPTLPLRGRDYGIVVVGKATTATEITSTENWLAAKTGIDVAKNISTTIYTRSGDTILDRANSTIERRA